MTPPPVLTSGGLCTQPWMSGLCPVSQSELVPELWFKSLTKFDYIAPIKRCLDRPLSLVLPRSLQSTQAPSRVRLWSWPQACQHARRIPVMAAAVLGPSGPESACVETLGSEDETLVEFLFRDHHF